MCLKARSAELLRLAEEIGCVEAVEAQAVSDLAVFFLDLHPQASQSSPPDYETAVLKIMV